MTISLVASDAKEDAEAGAANDGLAELTLSGTEGNIQIVFATHRSSTQTPSINGTGWSTPQLIETQIAVGSSRRAIVGWWRVVPASAGTTILAGWTADPGAVVGVGFEFSTDTAGGTWSFDGWDSSDNGTSATTSLLSGSVTPANNEAAAAVGLCARNGDVAAEDSYDSSFLTGPSSTSGTGSNALSGFSGYKIVDTTPAAMSTTASWTTSALATSLIGVASVDTGAGGATDLDGTDTTQAQTAAAAALTQVHELGADAAVQAQSATSPALTQTHELAADSATQAQSATAAALTQVHELQPTSAVQGQTATPAALVQTHELAATDAVQAQAAGPAAVTEGVTLTPASAVQGQEATTAALTQVHELTVVDVLQAQVADSAVLTQLHELVAASAVQAQVVTLPVVTEGEIVEPAPIALPAFRETAPAPFREQSVAAFREPTIPVYQEA